MCIRLDLRAMSIVTGRVSTDISSKLIRPLRRDMLRLNESEPIRSRDSSATHVDKSRIGRISYKVFTTRCESKACFHMSASDVGISDHTTLPVAPAHHSGFLARSACFNRSFAESGRASERKSSTCSGTDEAIFRNAKSCFSYRRHQTHIR